MEAIAMQRSERRELAEQRIPARFLGRHLGNYEPRTPSQAVALKAVEEWRKSLLDGPMLALVGPKGVGKSHLLYGAAWELYLSGITGIFVRPWYRFANQLRYADNRQQLRESMYGARVLLLDDVGLTASTDFDPRELAMLAYHCYDQLVPILVTSNVSPLEQLMGGPAADRFTVRVIEAPSGRDMETENEEREG